MLSSKIIYLKTAPPPEIALLLFDAEFKNHIAENSPPPPKLNFLLQMLIIDTKVPKEEISTAYGD